MKLSKKSPLGTSFHFSVFNASVNDLRKIFGEPSNSYNSGEEKINFEWVMETENGDVFTVYDWKEYRKITENEIIEWHIGGHSGEITEDALNEIAGALNELV